MATEKGKITSIKQDKGFGFIKCASGVDASFNFGDVEDKLTIKEGAEVEFQLQENITGNPIAIAKHIKVLGSHRSPYHTNQGRTFSPAVPVNLPNGTVFTTFYGDDGQLCPSLFFEAAQKISNAFDQANLKPTQYRQIYQQFLSLIIPLRKNEDYFPQAKEKFAILYTERIVRAHKRGVLPTIVKNFFDLHLKQALSTPKEMLGFFRYITSILCYLDKSK
ncbi:MAG: cold shock domain-containing protein [Deltaproteobacteria bacterium]|jgi:cold shock CspA family protein/CRISPR/Cas system CSM-associated protein Csm2 small subunit|nr:cold shock domain-containing protein [Deltaproteobacteria bacterium]